MTPDQKAVATQCLHAAERNEMSFPQILGRLSAAGFEGYNVDFRRGSASYYLPSGEALDLPMHRLDIAIAQSFNEDALQAAIREAQSDAPGFSYAGFCTKAAAAGCAGYIVSLPGRRVLYYGRAAELHVEHFPGQ